MHEQLKNIVEARTLEYGAFGANHAKRLLRLAERIAGDTPYDRDALFLAANLHDWGAYEPWKLPGVDHAVRSAEIIPAVLGELGVDARQVALVVECARHHHDCDRKQSLEAILLHDADALDFLGVTGVLRTFSMAPRDLRGAFETAHARCDRVRTRLILDRSRELAVDGLAVAQRVLAALEQETAGAF